MNNLWLALVAGVVAFPHCLGMCGGFALHLARGRSRWEMLGRQLLWHGGKTFTYVFLGALAGLLGGWVGRTTLIGGIQNILAYVSGGVMILMGASLLGLLPFPRQPSLGNGHSGETGLLTSIFRQFLAEPSPAGALALGLATGFLPCPIVLVGLVLCVKSGSPAAGMAVMAALGLGTVWSLLLLGLSGHGLSRWLRKWGTLAPGIILILLGTATVLRGTEAFHRILGCPSAPMQQTGEAACPCCERTNP